MALVDWLQPLLARFAKQLPSARQLAEVNERLRREAQAHEATLRDLEAAHRELEARVERRTKELSLVKARFETALHGAQIFVFSQDRNLKYTWIYSPGGEDAASDMIGRADEEILPPPDRDTVIAAKRRVLATGEPADCEVSYVIPPRRALFALHIDPTFGPDNKIDGIMCAAIEIGRIRSLESEQRRLTAELGTALQRYETALRGSQVTVYTQDRDLRYTSISAPMFGLDIDEIVGQRDDDVVPVESRASVIALKREVLDSGQAKDAEIRILDGITRWYDVHIEPLRDVAGNIVGLTCAAVDITARKAGEAHLRELMRELTHRSKNLLAVIQAMARQTARHAGTIDRFLEQYGARLQALAASHDLLVQESWYGASLFELIHSQLAQHLDRNDSQVSVDGPAILLKPEAAQSLGLALHELATNAAKYGALSAPNGRVGIEWRNLPAAEGDGIEIVWSESGGPGVETPTRRGFGSLVIERNLARSLEADVNLSFDPAGVRCRIVIPASNLAAGR
jgi:PAS domain S-box-containing protein